MGPSWEIKEAVGIKGMEGFFGTYKCQMLAITIIWEINYYIKNLSFFKKCVFTRGP